MRQRSYRCCRRLTCPRRAIWHLSRETRPPSKSHKHFSIWARLHSYYLFNCTLQSVHVRLKQGEMRKKEVLEIPLGLFLLTQGKDDADGNFLPPNYGRIGTTGFFSQAECLIGWPGGEISLKSCIHESHRRRTLMSGDNGEMANPEHSSVLPGSWPTSNSLSRNSLSWKMKIPACNLILP